jgi:hypothetical protein
VLRAILDHIPPLLGCSTFTAAANNYPWSRTDKAYMKRLLDFKLQADDALHRQISAQTDLLSLGDIPPRAMINRLLQECASPSGTLKVARHDTAAAARPRQSSPGNASRPNAIPRKVSTSLPTRGPVPQESADRIVIRLTQGGLDNNYLSLAEHLDFFPAVSIGAPTIQDGEGALLTLHFAGLPETVKTDIAGRHKIFRRRDPWRRFFAHHRLIEGDSLAIERLSPYEYRVVPLVPQPLGRGSRPRRLTERHRAASTTPVMLLISPSGMAHFPGCPHKGDDPDYDRWAELDAPGGWTRLGHGEHIRATGGNRPDLVAAARCRDCVEHGPW